MIKKVLTYCCLIPLLIGCLAEQDNPLIIGSCTDNIRNQNEEAVDCGGICEACPYVEPVIVPCETDLKDNRITFDGSDVQLTYDDIAQSQESEYYEVYVLKQPYYVTIQIYGTSLPAVETAYELVPWYDLEPGTASIKYNNFYTFNALSGKLYLTYLNGTWNIEVCPVTLYGGGYEREFSGRIVID